ncbi:hypothetical protein ATN83_2207 [Raoultella ornithinolytica]|nr:hypothetical protein ATN83_2207 [Raoultella ornithinolytica]KDV93279.1 hypothetical protein AB00_2943 [Raoultella ornithinolytica 2-156-04_S1_C1]KDX15636.1 hypothetical protein AB28_1741 [Raoultella ornithinolytica 2-156-04_S1_C2]
MPISHDGLFFYLVPLAARYFFLFAHTAVNSGRQTLKIKKSPPLLTGIGGM